MSSGSRSGMNKSKMRYVGKDSSFSINGNITGRMYTFNSKNLIVSVDPRDADDFLDLTELQRVS